MRQLQATRGISIRQRKPALNRVKINETRQIFVYTLKVSINKKIKVGRISRLSSYKSMRESRLIVVAHAFLLAALARPRNIYMESLEVFQ